MTSQGLYTNKPIGRASDLRGTRMRTYNATTERIAQLLGASEKAAASSVEELRKHGMKIERVAVEFLTDIKRLGERFSLEWIKTVGQEANQIFVPYYTQQ